MVRVTESDLKVGETVYLSQYVLGGFCLLVKRNGLVHVVHRSDGFVHRFDGRGEVALYCRDKGLVLLGEYERSVVREKRLLSPEFADEEPSPSPASEMGEDIQQIVAGAIRRQASIDLERLVFLTEKRERLLEELNLELARREARGNKSCLCRTCLHVLESPLGGVQGEIDKIWSWWGTALGVTPADVLAGSRLKRPV